MSYIRTLTERVGRGREPSSRARREASLTDGSGPVLIRMARDGDKMRLSELAELDSATPLSGPSLLAFVDDRVWAAVSLADGRVIADPFRPTSSAVALLRVRAEQLLGGKTAVAGVVRRQARAWRRARA